MYLLHMLWIRIAAALGFLGVALGAFGAHALKTRLAPEMLAAWHTGVLYHLIHALAPPRLSSSASRFSPEACTPWP
jgi:uncharacterized membrane protein YgdD (TMEM256/DUF423 family)